MSDTRYFLTGACACPEPTEHEVSQVDYRNAKQDAEKRAVHFFREGGAGFTAYFSDRVVSGRTEEVP